MSELTDRITAVLAAEMDEHGCEDDEEKRLQVAHHWAERVVAELNLTALQAELDGAKATIAHMSEAMSWIAGHDRQGLDHLQEAMEASAQRDAAENELRRLVPGWVAVENNQPQEKP
jgi:hypothetical protein